MKKLLSFEFFKRWRSYRVGFVGEIALQIILIVPLAVFNCMNFRSIPSAVVAIVYMFILATILFFPPIESITRFNRDIFGNVAVLELSLPLPAWKKVLSKLIVTFCFLLAALLLCTVSLTALWMLTDGAKFFKEVASLFAEIGAHSSQAAEITAFIVLNGIASFCIIIFSLVLSRAITHRIKTASWISGGIFIGLLTIYIILHVQIYINFGMIPTILYLIALSVIMFLSASWLLENKVEV